MDLILVDSKPQYITKFNAHKNSRLAYWQLSFNNERGPFSHIKLRRAISLGIDFNLLAEKMDWDKNNIQAGLYPLGMRGV